MGFEVVVGIGVGLVFQVVVLYECGVVGYVEVVGEQCIYFVGLVGVVCVQILVVICFEVELGVQVLGFVVMVVCVGYVVLVVWQVGYVDVGQVGVGWGWYDVGLDVVVGFLYDLWCFDFVECFVFE